MCDIVHVSESCGAKACLTSNLNMSKHDQHSIKAVAKAVVWCCVCDGSYFSVSKFSSHMLSCWCCGCSGLVSEAMNKTDGEFVWYPCSTLLK